MADEAPIVTETPGTPEPGPVSGTPPGTGDGGTATETAPAASSSSDTEQPSTSLLGEAKPDGEVVGKPEPTDSTIETVKPEAKEEPKAEEKTDVVPEKPAEPAPAPTYEAFTTPEGVTIDEAKIGAFTGLLGAFEQQVVADPSKAHEAAQAFGQQLIDLYVAEAQEAANRNARLQADHWQRTREGWAQDFREDPDIGRNRAETSLARMGAFLTLYGQRNGAEAEKAFRDAMTLTGAGDHPAVMKFVHWASRFAVETPRLVPAIVPKGPATPGSKAQRLYRNSAGAA